MSRARVFWLVFLGLLMIASPNLSAETTCYQMISASLATATSPTVFEGQGQFSLEGTYLTASFTVTVLERKIAGGGAIIDVTETVLDFGGGNTIKADARTELSPTDDPYVYRLDERVTVIEGTGSFEGSSGWVNDQGYFSVITGQWFAIGRGRICLQLP